MSIRAKHSHRCLGIALASITIAAIPLAQVAPANAEPSIPEAFNRAFYQNDKPFDQNRSPLRQIDYLFGKGIIFRNSFTENEITRDGRAVHDVYIKVLNQQLNGDPVVRTPDLPNPYNRSLLTLPPANFNTRPLGSELNFESIPLR